MPRATGALLLLLTAGVTLAGTPLPPYDFTGHWTGAIVAAGNSFAVSSDFTATGERTFTVAAIISDVQCPGRGKRKRRVVIRVVCLDGRKAKLTGVLAGDTLTGKARLKKRGRHARGDFVLEKAPVPVCGNGSVESGEQCDDGNTDGGDGCSAACLVETFTDLTETEPNGAPAQADAAAPLPAIAHGAVTPGGDQDFYRVELAGTDLILETFDGNGPGSCALGTDTFIELWAPDGVTVLATDDDGGLGSCSRLELHGLTPGVYFACVRGLTLGTLVPAYQLQIIAP
jgi:cysteine-rich repeat protein